MYGIGPQLVIRPNFWPLLIGGAALGAGIGSYGKDNWGWSSDAIWQGALAVGGGAAMYGAAGAGAGAGAGTGAGPGGLGKLAAEGSKWMGTTAGVGTAGPGTFAAGSAGGFSMASMANPLLLGAAGLGLASAYGTQGSAFAQKIKLSKEGKALQKDYQRSVKTRMAKAKKGDVDDLIFQEMSALRKAEGTRKRITQGTINVGQAFVGNRPKEQRGGGVVSGQFVKAQVADLGESMAGEFAPTSLLNNTYKEELINATKHVSNLYNEENQTAMYNFSSGIAKWQANESLASRKGAALGGVVAMLGRAYSNTAYLNAMKIAG